MSSTRTGYTALTPEFADFAIPHTPVPSASSSRLREALPETQHRRKLDAVWSRARGLVNNNTGLLLVASSQAFFSSMNVAVKILNGIDPPVSTFELIAVRMGITYVCSITYMQVPFCYVSCHTELAFAVDRFLMGIPDPILGPKGVRSLLVFRGFIGFFGLFGVYYSLQYLSLSDATVLTFLAPMCTTVAGSIFLGEKFSHREILAGFVSLIGVVLIARPAAIFGDSAGKSQEKGTPRDRLIAVGVALIGVLGATGAYTSIRAIGKRAHPLHSLTFFSALCVVVSSTGLIINKTPFIIPNRLEWLGMLAMIGIFGFVAQFLLAMGLQRETAGRGSMAVYTQVIFATILEKIFFHATPSALSIIGTLLIIGSALYVALIKESQSTPDTKPINMQRREAESAALEEGLLSSRDDDQDERDDFSTTSQIPSSATYKSEEDNDRK
ncbi:hypothetical protein D9619_008739 [Psilocybe cf. subviscida]|uniref:EamA domain-containing protein n=1 Tax=Psilocybe cf. subviscida TaxID=2480587 RepID=A0A8H5BA52_9AGAR|nr:hypothetical protein D9619_008739 [Psilocybe cf. subviscida]